MRNTTIHIVEPTLASEAGHCFGYCQSLVGIDANIDLHLWMNKHGLQLFNNKPVICHGYFSRRLRKIQQYFLYKRLLDTDTIIFVPTAGRSDMVMLDKLSKHTKPRAQVVLHFHQFSRSAKKLTLLKHFANTHPDWLILAPTERLLTVFKQAGFKRCQCVACPSYSPVATSEASAFQSVLYAGAARQDKGFVETVNTVLSAAEHNKHIAFRIQTSPPESGRYDESSQQALTKLQALQSNSVTIIDKTLSQHDYLSQFTGSICLQAYDPNSYHDKFSGVTLDAICAGAPVITAKGTWMADTVERFNAGIVVDDRAPATLLAAIEQAVANYSQLQHNCLRASKQLADMHHPRHTLAAVTQYAHAALAST